jgi:hypothetical protein
LSLELIIQNAGVHDFAYEVSPDGWFSDIQVNVLSTLLLGLLMLQWLRGNPTQAHLGFVGTGAHFENNDLSKWPKQDVLQFWNMEENFISGQANYAVSKLLLQYGVQEMAVIAAAHGR